MDHEKLLEPKWLEPKWLRTHKVTQVTIILLVDLGLPVVKNSSLSITEAKTEAVWVNELDLLIINHEMGYSNI